MDAAIVVACRPHGYAPGGIGKKWLNDNGGRRGSSIVSVRDADGPVTVEGVAAGKRRA